MSDKRTEERNDTFDSAMREKLAGYEPTVPHALWTRISAELNEAEEAIPSIPHYTQTATTPRWKVAVAAAIVITIGAGSLLFTFTPKNEISATTITPVSNKAAATPPIATHIVETKSVAQAAPIVSHTPATVAVKAEQKVTPVPLTIDDHTTADDTQATPANNEESQLAAMPPSTENNPVDVGNIPVYSLNKLSAPVSLNDEITVIKSVSTKKKHHRRNDDEESTKVIVIGKKFDTKPDIRYQVPVRF
jgi:hypothetical protein